MAIQEDSLRVPSAQAELEGLSRLELYCPHTPSPRQREFLRLGCREAMYGGRAGCGKSDVLIMAALQGIAIPSYQALILRRTYKDLMKPGAILDRMMKWFKNSPAKWSEKHMWFEFPSGARIAVGYLDHDTDVEQYDGPDYQFIAFEEGSQFSEHQLKYMFGRLRRTRDFPKHLPLRVRIATNPGGQGHEFLCRRYGITPEDRFPEQSPPKVVPDATDGVRVFLAAHPKDNPGLDWDDYRKSMAELPLVRRMQVEDGIWIQDSAGLCYPSISMLRKVPQLPKGHVWRYGLALDIGASNNCAIAIGATAEDLPESYLARTEEPPELNTPRDVALHIRALDNIYHFEFMTADHGALGKGYINEMRKWYQLPIVNAEKNDKPGYIKLLDGAIENGMVVAVDGQCTTFTEQAEGLIWKDAQQKEEMPGRRNHSCDAVLYWWRKSGHYSSAPRDATRDGMDDLELQALSEQERLSEQVNRYGVQFPDCYSR